MDLLCDPRQLASLTVGPCSLTRSPSLSGFLCYLLAAKQAGPTGHLALHKCCVTSDKCSSLAKPQLICRRTKQNSDEEQALDLAVALAAGPPR